MKRIALPALVIFFWMGVGMLWRPGPTAAAKNPLDELKKQNLQAVVNEIAADVVSRLPDDIHFRLLGIGPIEGDDGILVDALTAKIKSDTNYHLIERKDLKKLLEEQGIQLSPITDSRTHVEPGRIQGVEGLLMGRVTASQCSFLYCSQEVFIKLNDVEGGEVVFAEDFQARFLPPVTVYGAAGIVVLILLVIYGSRKKKEKYQKAVGVSRQDAQTQLAVQSELKKVRKNINSAHDDLVAKDKTDLSTALRVVREDVNALLSRMEQQPGVHHSSVQKATKSELRSHAKDLREAIKKLLDESDKVVKAGKSGDDKGVRSAIEGLKTEARNTAKRIYERPAGRA